MSDRSPPVLFADDPLGNIAVDMNFVECAAGLMRKAIDFRSPFTATHSTGVSSAVGFLAERIGFSDAEMRDLKIAGSLHDLGKLAVPNTILEKPGALTFDEVLVVKSHTFHTYATLRGIKGFDRIAEWAGFHHERLDGSGYPFHLGAEEISLGSKVMMVADMFSALSETRPYRGGLQKADLLAVLKDFSEKRLLDRQVVGLLVEDFDWIHDGMAEGERRIYESYENDFLNGEDPRDTRFVAPDDSGNLP